MPATQKGPNPHNTHQFPFLRAQKIGLIDDFLLTSCRNHFVFPLLGLYCLRSIRSIERNCQTMRSSFSGCRYDERNVPSGTLAVAVRIKLAFPTPDETIRDVTPAGRPETVKSYWMRRLRPSERALRDTDEELPPCKSIAPDRSRKYKISIGGARINLDIKHWVKLDHIFCSTVLMVEKVKEANTSDLAPGRWPSERKKLQ